MRHDQFITEIEAYYGQYPRGQKKYIDNYLRRTFGESSLSSLFGLVLKNCSSRYGKAPDIEAFEKLSADVEEALKYKQPDLNVKAIEDKPDYLSEDALQSAIGKLARKWSEPWK